MVVTVIVEPLIVKFEIGILSLPPIALVIKYLWPFAAAANPALGSVPPFVPGPDFCGSTIAVTAVSVSVGIVSESTVNNITESSVELSAMVPLISVSTSSPYAVCTLANNFNCDIPSLIYPNCETSLFQLMLGPNLEGTSIAFSCDA